MLFKKFLFPIFWFTNLGVLLYFWYFHSFSLLSSGPGDLLTALARLAGLLAVYFVLLQFILLGREVWIEQLYGLDRLTRIHHLNGQVSIFFIIAHPVLVITGYAINKKTDIIQQFLDFLFNYQDIWKAEIAFVLFISIVGLSYAIVKKHLQYELWYTVHLLAYLAIALAWGHQLKLGQDFQTNAFIYYWYLLYAFVFGNVLFYRFMRPLYFFFENQFSVIDIKPETDTVRSVYISGKKLQSYPIKPGQFIILRFLDKKNWWKPHPFSLSQPVKDNLLRVSIKNSGDFTSQINMIKKGTRVLIDGPYGVFTLPKKSNKLLFLAGGIGITPIRSLTEQATIQGKDIVLLYSNKTVKDIVFKKELDGLAKQYSFPIHYFVTDDPMFTGQKGRITKEKITELVPDIRDREIFICGPTPMMKSLRSDLLTLKVPAPQIHMEDFSL
jgi:predicted ferric reductase